MFVLIKPLPTYSIMPNVTSSTREILNCGGWCTTDRLVNYHKTVCKRFTDYKLATYIQSVAAGRTITCSMNLRLAAK